MGTTTDQWRQPSSAHIAIASFGCLQLFCEKKWRDSNFSFCKFTKDQSNKRLAVDFQQHGSFFNVVKIYSADHDGGVNELAPAN